MASEAFNFRPRDLWPVWQNWQPNGEPGHECYRLFAAVIFSPRLAGAETRI